MKEPIRIILTDIFTSFPPPLAAPPAPLPPMLLPQPDWNSLALQNDDLYFDALKWFAHCYNELPRRRMFNLGGEKPRTDVMAALASRYDLSSAAVAHSEFREEASEATQYPHTAFCLAPHVLLELHPSHFNRFSGTVTLYYSPRADNTLLQELTQLLQSFLYKIPENNQLHLLKTNRNGNIQFDPMEFNAPQVNLALHYNDDLPAVHTTILRRLQQHKDKGLVLLYGPPGTGKTTYMRYLCSLISHKRRLFVPPQYAAQISDPGFLKLLSENPDSILIIEDAEQLLLSREKNASQSVGVSGLLNLTDGFLSDCLNVQVICSFNTDISRLDSALLRKGRLIAAYEFLPLTLPKAQALATVLNLPELPTTPLPIADLFSQEPNYSPKTQPDTIGFGRT